jgi:hypothetical protein
MSTSNTTNDGKAKALDEDFFIRNAIHCWLYYFDEKHKWHSIYKDLAERESYIGQPAKPNHDGQDELLGSRLKGYEVCLSDEIIYILAANAEEAAWYALELSNELDSYLIDVRLIDE